MIWIILVMSIFISGCDTVRDLFVEKDLLRRPESKRCGECHKVIYDQWKKSRHSKSWISGDYIKRTENYRKIKCYGCHIPYQVDPLKEPDFRKENRHDGVSCVSCHFKDETGSMHGAYNVFSPPHPSKKDPDYERSEICGGCHKRTYQQWKKTGSSKSCQNCHMPARRGYLIQKLPFKYFHLKKDLHDHSFPVVVPDREFFDIKVKAEDSVVMIKIKNKKIPHSVPTSDNGKPRYYITVEFFKDERSVGKEKYIVTSKDPINYGEEKLFEFYTFENFSRLRVLVERKLSWQDKKEKVLEEVFRKEDLLVSP